MAFAGKADMGSGTSQGNPTMLKKAESATCHFVVRNQGAPNEHVYIASVFSKPGNYKIYTDKLGSSAGNNLENQQSLNRGLTLAAELLRSADQNPPQMPAEYPSPSSWL